jgi:hypothetical protein
MKPLIKKNVRWCIQEPNPVDLAVVHSQWKKWIAYMSAPVRLKHLVAGGLGQLMYVVIFFYKWFRQIRDSMVSGDVQLALDIIPTAISVTSLFVETLNSAMTAVIAAAADTHTGSAKRPLEYGEEVQASKRMRNQ